MTDSFALVVGALGNRMTSDASVRGGRGARGRGRGAGGARGLTPRPTALGPAAVPAASVPPGVALGTTGVFLTSGTAITLNRGAAAAPMTLQCKRTTGRCRGTVTLRARGPRARPRGHRPHRGGPDAAHAPDRARQRKRLRRRRTRAILSVASAGATSTRLVTLAR